MKTILAPIDFSSATDRVIDAAAALAQAVGGHVVLLHVVQPPILTSDYGLAMENLQEVITISEKNAAKRLAQLEETVRARWPDVEVEQVSGTAVAEILDWAREHRPDYIVMGSHGHTALYDLIVGGTTHGILRRSLCPVVVVPPPAKERAA